MFSTGDLVHKMLNTFDIQELSGALMTIGRTLPDNFLENLLISSNQNSRIQDFQDFQDC